MTDAQVTQLQDKAKSVGMTVSRTAHNGARLCGRSGLTMQHTDDFDAMWYYLSGVLLGYRYSVQDYKRRTQCTA